MNGGRRQLRPKSSPAIRQGKSVTPANTIDSMPVTPMPIMLSNEPDKPILIRQSMVTRVRSPNKIKSSPGYYARTRQAMDNVVKITIPRDCIEVSGLELGMTVVIEAYRDGRLRIFPAGDVTRKEDELI